MNLVDSSGWLEYFTDDKNSKYFAPAIENTKKIIVSTINLYEVYKKILQESNENNAIEALGLMQQAKVVDVTNTSSIQVARTSYEYKIPMVDSLIYTTGRLNDAVVWTQDYDFKKLEGVKFIKK